MEKKKSTLDSGAEFRHGWWREVIARRDALKTEVDLDKLPPMEAPDEGHHGDPNRAVSWRIRVAAAWSWRLIIIVVAAIAIVYGITQVAVATIPIAIALLLTLLLEPLHFALQKIGVSKTISAVISLVAGVGLVGVLLAVASTQLASSAPELGQKAAAGFNKLMQWLSDGPLHLDQTDIDKYLNQLSTKLGALVRNYSGSIASSALSLTSSVVSVLTTMVISLFCMFFFLKDGRQIWVWLLRMLPVTAREPVHEAGIRGWVTLKGYIKAQAIVAFVDSIFIALGAFFLGAGSMTVPLALLIFLGSFIPIVGALVTGTVAVLIILLDQGIWSAVIMLVVILAVQQIEGNILQPMLMSNAVSLHPLAVVLSVTAGTFLAGIIGALLAVPVVAFLNIVTLYLSGHDSMPGLSDRRDRIGGPPHTIHAQIAASYLRADRAATERSLAVQTASELASGVGGAGKGAPVEDGSSVPGEGTGSGAVTSSEENPKE